LIKKTILSGIQPSGNLCIGNYLGALKQWKELQSNYESIFLVVDLHSITGNQIPADLRKRCLSFVAQYIACGINPEKSKIIIQSHVPQHAELMWVLSCLTYQGELSRMTQYKSKSKNLKNINAGLFTYPILMAADILLYQADLVPVGSDQKQHLELSRDIAMRFNNKYSKTFKIPKSFIPKSGSRIMSLQNPDDKMSKSDNNLNNIITLLDGPSIIKKKISRAVTDSGSKVIYDKKNKVGLSNLINIYRSLSMESVSDIENKYIGKMYSDFKKDLSELVIESLNPIKSEYDKIIKDKDYLLNVLKSGSEYGYNKSQKTLSKVYRKIGFIPRVR
jgi:tryptophanyl-tRNA synthetase